MNRSVLRNIGRGLALLAPVVGISESLAQYVAHAADWDVTTYFGDTDEIHHTPHKGVDFALSNGTPVKSIVDGTVTSVTDEGSRSYGKAIRLLDTQGREVLYGHLSRVEVHTGEYISFGQEVALSGNTGNSTGPHLHVEVRINGTPVDPMPLIRGASLRKMVREVSTP